MKMLAELKERVSLTVYKHATVARRNTTSRHIRNNAFWSCLLILTLISSSSLVNAQSFNKGGRTALQFLKIGIGARQAAMGEANIAAVEDINSVFWDPAGLTGVSGAQASFDFNPWIAGMNYFAGAAGFKVNEVGVFAVDYASLSYGNIPEALVSVSSGSNDTRTGNTFTGGDALIGLAYSHDFTDQLSIGIAAKYLKETLFTYSASTLAFDVGTVYDVGYKGIHVAMSAQNFAGAVKFMANSNNQAGYELPLIFRIGLSFGFIGSSENAFIDLGKLNSLIISADAVHTNDYTERLDIGGEYVFDDFLSLRAGYRFNYTEGNLSLGVGVKGAVSGLNIQVDYAYTRYTYLESPNRLSVLLNF